MEGLTKMYSEMQFQFTRPIRAAIHPVDLTRLDKNFNSRDPYGPRLTVHLNIFLREPISIHATHTGRDCVSVSTVVPAKTFQFTRPIRAAMYDQEIDYTDPDNFNSRDPYGPR